MKLIRAFVHLTEFMKLAVFLWFRTNTTDRLNDSTAYRTCGWMSRWMHFPMPTTLIFFCTLSLIILSFWSTRQNILNVYHFSLLIPYRSAWIASILDRLFLFNNIWTQSWSNSIYINVKIEREITLQQTIVSACSKHVQIIGDHYNFDRHLTLKVKAFIFVASIIVIIIFCFQRFSSTFRVHVLLAISNGNIWYLACCLLWCMRHM